MAFSSTQFSLDASTQHLRQLTVIRSLLLVLFWCSFLASFYIDNINLPYKEVAFILCLFNSIHLLTFLRLRQSVAVTHIEFFIQLLLDVIFLNILFYFSGGGNNPFISYLLVPVCISAATLPWRFTWFISALCIVAYTGLLFFHIALPIFSTDHMHGHSQLNWHILGMWFNFFVSAVLITYFVVKMARSLRQQEALLNKMREDELRNEHVIAVATLAAGAAHEINTPLATMHILLNELRDQYQADTPLLTDLTLLSQQVDNCAKSLKQMVQDSSSAMKGQCKHQPIRTWCNSILDRWQLMRPEATFIIHFSLVDEARTIAYDTRLDQAIMNVLHNAADANPENISIAINADQGNLYWEIIDNGAGISDEVLTVLGRETFSTKETGLGLGLLLSHVTIKHYGGRVTQLNNVPHGTKTMIILPLTTLNNANY